MSDDLVKRLQATSAARASATAHDDPQNYLLVVARLSHEDAALMAEAAARIAELEAEVARGWRFKSNSSMFRESTHGGDTVSISVKPLKEGGFVVAQNRCWVDGVYDSEAAARLGAKCDPGKLALIWQQRLAENRDGFLTVEDFK